MAEQDDARAVKSKAGKGKDKDFPPQIFAEDMSDEWSKDAVKVW